MQIIRDFESYVGCCGEEPYIYAIGAFDGVHLGHRYLIDAMKMNRNYKIGIVSFVLHPRHDKENFKGVLTSDSEKIELFRGLGVDRVILVDFEKIKDYEYKKFLDFLINHWGLKALIGGKDNAIGKNREGKIDLIAENFEKKIAVEILDFKKYDFDDPKISSSDIRLLVENGDIRKANNLLKFVYTIEGTTQKGRQVGRKMGFPTLNVEPLCKNKIVPSDGVYFVSVVIDGIEYFGGCNIGFKPTFNEKNRTIEIYVINVNNELFYVGESSYVKVRFYERIRDEQKFNNEDELIEQITKDINVIKKLSEEKDYESY